MTPLSMLDVIRIGATKRPMPAPCPCCGVDAPLASRDFLRNVYSIQCEWEWCAEPFYAEGDTLAEAWDRWNARIPA